MNTSKNILVRRVPMGLCYKALLFSEMIPRIFNNPSSFVININAINNGIDKLCN